MSPPMMIYLVFLSAQWGLCYSVQCRIVRSRIHLPFPTVLSRVGVDYGTLLIARCRISVFVVCSRLDLGFHCVAFKLCKQYALN